MIWVKLWAMLKPLGESTTFIHLPWVFVYDYNISNQGCGLRTITRGPEVANHEILGALHLPKLKYLQVFSSHPMTKVHCLQHPGTSFKMISSPYCTISKPQCLWVSLKEMQINKFIMNCLPCLGGILYSLANTFFDILQLWSCFTKWYQRKQSIELHIKTKMYTNFQECAVWAVNHLPLAQLYKTDIFYKEIHSVDIYLIFWNHIVAIISNISLINLC